MTLREIARTLGVRIPRGVDDRAHEIAHWLVAAPERRHLIGYGLGLPYFRSGFGTAHLTVPAGQSSAEEQSASALGICLLWTLGRRKLAYRVFQFHEWYLSDESLPDHWFEALDNARHGIRELRRRTGIKIRYPTWEELRAAP